MVDIREVMEGKVREAEQNLASPTKVSPGGESKSTNLYKSIALDVVSVGSAALFGFFYLRYLTAGLSVWLLLGALVLFGIASVMQALLTKNYGRRLLMLLLETIALLVFFAGDDHRVLLLAGAMVFLFLMWGYASCRIYLSESIEIPFFHATGAVLGKLTTAALLFMILIYAPQFNQSNLFFSRQSFRIFFDWASGVVTSFYPNVHMGGTFGNFADGIVTMELNNNPSFQSLTTDEKAAAVAEASTQFENNFKTGSSTPVDASAPTSDAFYNLIIGMLKAWQTKSSTWFLVGWAVVLFFSLRTLGILFVWAAQFLSLLFYESLIAVGFMKITEQPHTKEVVDY